MSEVLLTLDLGVTTGWAIFRERALEDYGQATNLSHSLPLLLTQYLPDIVVAERPLIIRGPLGDQLGKIVALAHFYLDGARRTLEYIEPSDWKPTPASKEVCPRGTSQHEKDAIRIGHWYYRFKLQGS
jgi:hypothetical protein